MELPKSILPHPSYSFGLGPTIYSMFLSLENALMRNLFSNENQIQELISNIFISKSMDF